MLDQLKFTMLAVTVFGGAAGAMFYGAGYLLSGELTWWKLPIIAYLALEGLLFLALAYIAVRGYSGDPDKCPDCADGCEDCDCDCYDYDD